jgi:preprotein translocase subunit SecD
MAVQLAYVGDLDTLAELIGTTAKLEFREFTDSNVPPGTTPTLENTKPTGISGKDLKSATVDNPQSDTEIKNGYFVRSGYAVRIKLVSKSADSFREVTKRLIGKPLAVFLDDQLISAPIHWDSWMAPRQGSADLIVRLD